MKQKSRIVSKLFAALVILTLISCCFLGSTFARYTSQSTGTASVGVAKWDVDITNNAGANSWETKLDFAKLSPSMNGDTSADQYNSTGKVLVAEVKNNSEVAANVTLSLDEWKLTTQTDGKTPESTPTCPTYAMVYGVFQVNIYIGEEQTAKLSVAANATENNSVTVDLKAVSGEDVASVKIYAEVVWLTKYQTGNYTEPWTADFLDTWIGENIASLGFTINCTAVQASELPGNN